MIVKDYIKAFPKQVSEFKSQNARKLYVKIDNGGLTLSLMYLYLSDACPKRCIKIIFLWIQNVKSFRNAILIWSNLFLLHSTTGGSITRFPALQTSETMSAGCQSTQNVTSHFIDQNYAEVVPTSSQQYTFRREDFLCRVCTNLLIYIPLFLFKLQVTMK